MATVQKTQEVPNKHATKKGLKATNKVPTSPQNMGKLDRAVEIMTTFVETGKYTNKQIIKATYKILEPEGGMWNTIKTQLSRGRSYDAQSKWNRFGKVIVENPKTRCLEFSKIDKETPTTEELEEPCLYPEGAKKQITVNSYERNHKARESCIKHYGSQCSICGFDFSKCYGQEYDGFIHVHHIKPLSEVDEKYKVDHINDLIPVCPNCHAVIHYNRGQTLTILQMQEKINKNKQ